MAFVLTLFAMGIVLMAGLVLGIIFAIIAAIRGSKNKENKALKVLATICFIPIIICLLVYFLSI